MEKKIIEISWGSLWRIFLFAVLIAIFYLNIDIFLALFLAIVISAGLDIFIDFLEKRGLPRVVATIFVFVLALLIVAIILYTVIPLIIIDLNNILTNLNKYNLNKYLGPVFSIKSSSIFDLINKLSEKFFSGDSSPLDLVMNIAGNALLSVTIFISSFYLSLTKNGIEKFIRAVFPLNYESMALRIYERARIKISRWFRAQILLSLSIFILVFTALLILGVRHAFFIALLAGLIEIVPYVGPIVAGGTAFISAFTTSFSLAIYVLIVFILIQQLENHFLVPLFMKKSIDLHPVIVITALLIGGKIGGILGILVSLPLTVVIQEIIEERISNVKRNQIF
jgi:predicted PurR-regulated permease PerM